MSFRLVAFVFFGLNLGLAGFGVGWLVVVGVYCGFPVVLGWVGLVLILTVWCILRMIWCVGLAICW